MKLSPIFTIEGDGAQYLPEQKLYPKNRYFGANHKEYLFSRLVLEFKLDSGAIDFHSFVGEDLTLLSFSDSDLIFLYKGQFLVVHAFPNTYEDCGELSVDSFGGTELAGIYEDFPGLFPPQVEELVSVCAKMDTIFIDSKQEHNSITQKDKDMKDYERIKAKYNLN